MSENLYTVQKTYEALATPDTPEGKKLQFDETRIFKTEYDRQIYLASLKSDGIDAAITWLEKPENKGVDNAAAMLDLLKRKKAKLHDIQQKTRKDLSKYATVIDALIPTEEWKENTTKKTVSFQDGKDTKTYPVFIRESNEGGMDVEIRDSGVATRITGVPADKLDAVLVSYEAANMPNAAPTLKPLQDSFLSGTVKYEDIKNIIVPVEPVTRPSVKPVPEKIDTPKEMSILDMLKKINKPKGHELSYDETIKQVRIMKGKNIIAYFTVGNKENEDKKTVDDIQKWVDKKTMKPEGKKADAPKADAPKADAPKADAPKADAPKADAPKTPILKNLSAESVRNNIHTSDGLILSNVKDTKNGSYDLDIHYNSKSASLWEYSMIPTERIVVTPAELKSGKTWKNVDFRALMVGSDEKYIPGFGQTFNIVLGTDGTLKLESNENVVMNKKIEDYLSSEGFAKVSDGKFRHKEGMLVIENNKVDFHPLTKNPLTMEQKKWIASVADVLASK